MTWGAVVTRNDDGGGTHLTFGVTKLVFIYFENDFVMDDSKSWPKLLFGIYEPQNKMQNISE